MVFTQIRRYFKRRNGKPRDIDPDEIMLDSKNLPDFDLNQFKGRIEKPISIFSILIFSSILVVIFLFLIIKAWTLQIHDGSLYAEQSENNRLKHQIIFADRGAIFDRNGVKLAWNTLPKEGTDFSLRSYRAMSGFAHVLGYIQYPMKDSNGFYYRKDFEGISGVEKAYNDVLRGVHGLKIIETNALLETASESTIEPTRTGENLTLSIDSRVQEKLYGSIKDLSKRVGFVGGSGAIMNINTGEIIALVSYPEYDSNVMIMGDSDKIKTFVNDPKNPFLNRFVEGLYTPGSIVKPYVALAALAEKVIDPNKEILSTGAIYVPNPYDKTKNTKFSDWKVHGLVDMRKALAVSSNVYFYEIGGGFEDQKGLGIAKLEKYFSIFGFGKAINTQFFNGPAGTIPTPEWKEKFFKGDPWRVGDTYYTAIGQYGFQVTPLQELIGMAAIANGGFLLEPSILIHDDNASKIESIRLPFSKEEFNVIHEGMREGVVSGTASGLSVPYVKVAAKTGTAELGTTRQFVNSWATGFFPYEEPKYAFVVLMDGGPRANVFGGIFVMRELLDWMNQNAREYIK